MVLDGTTKTSNTSAAKSPTKYIPIKMDGPSIPWTVSDLFLQPPKLAMIYHVLGISYDLLTPIGALLGAAAAATTTRTVSSSSIIPRMANGGIVGGGLGLCIGAAALYSKASQGETLEPLPWNDEGIATRVAGIQQNYKLRTMDASVWTGIVTAGSLYLLLLLRNQKRSSPFLLRPLQAVSLGSTLGALTGIALIGYTEYQINKALNANDDDDDDGK